MANAKTQFVPDTRATYVVRQDLAEKMKFIAFWERTHQKDQVNAAFEHYIKDYEKKHGKINLLSGKTSISNAA